MDTEYIKQLISDEVEKQLQKYGLIKKDDPQKEQVQYNRMYMRDSWYND
jgi:hypothetical protein